MRLFFRKLSPAEYFAGVCSGGHRVGPVDDDDVQAQLRADRPGKALVSGAAVDGSIAAHDRFPSSRRRVAWRSINRLIDGQTVRYCPNRTRQKSQ